MLHGQVFWHSLQGCLAYVGARMKEKELVLLGHHSFLSYFWKTANVDRYDKALIDY